MIWKPCNLLNTIKVEDELGNLVATIETKIVANTRARFSPLNTEQILADDREVTKTERQFVVPLSKSAVMQAEYAEMDGTMYAIKSVSELSPRWCVITVGVYKQ